eukprot:3579437-Pyramimonas_sp.AAC.1
MIGVILARGSGGASSGARPLGCFAARAKDALSFGRARGLSHSCHHPGARAACWDRGGGLPASRPLVARRHRAGQKKHPTLG